MNIVHKRIFRQTTGTGDLIDITADLQKQVSGAGFSIGSITVFVVGSTAGITTFEFEPGLIADIREFYGQLIPSGRGYHHDETWGDANGYSHLRATLTGQSLTIPFEGGTLLLGTWQQVVLAEFDNRPRKREVVVQIVGM